MKYMIEARRPLRESLIWRLDLLICTASIAAFFACVVLYVLMSATWIKVTGAAGSVLAIFFIAFYCYYVHGLITILEDKLRGRGAYRFDVFISYRILQHREIAGEVAESLEAHSLT